MGTLSKIGDPLRAADCRSCLEGAARLRVFRYRLAGVLQSQGQLEQAEAEYRAVLAAETERLGVDHPDTMVTRFELAGVLQQRGDRDAVLAEYSGCSARTTPTPWPPAVGSMRWRRFPSRLSIPAEGDQHRARGLELVMHQISGRGAKRTSQVSSSERPRRMRALVTLSWAPEGPDAPHAVPLPT